ncbi:hypothetical protein GA0115259_1000917 [Streptomyces sp. MnatMP-M17]|nr:hypothetical protein GA0115259_1000917 [Streptomyces sp. MnatMP-M17]
MCRTEASRGHQPTAARRRLPPRLAVIHAEGHPRTTSPGGPARRPALTTRSRNGRRRSSKQPSRLASSLPPTWPHCVWSPTPRTSTPPSSPGHCPGPPVPFRVRVLLKRPRQWHHGRALQSHRRPVECREPRHEQRAVCPSRSREGHTSRSGRTLRPGALHHAQEVGPRSRPRTGPPQLREKQVKMSAEPSRPRSPGITGPLRAAATSTGSGQAVVAWAPAAEVPRAGARCAVGREPAGRVPRSGAAVVTARRAAAVRFRSPGLGRQPPR